MTKKYLFDWNVETLFSMEDRSLKRIAIMTWVQKLEELSWLMEEKKSPNRNSIAKAAKPTKFQLENLYCTETKKFRGAYLSWRYKGYPSPKLINKDGSLGIPFELERKYPGSLRSLLHPGWAMLCGPNSIEACRSLLAALEPSIVEILDRRFWSESPNLSVKESTLSKNLERILIGQSFYTHGFVELLKQKGTFEAFIAALGLSIEYFFGELEFGTSDIIFEFNPSDWSFCKSLDKQNLDFLVRRINELNRTYVIAAKKNLNSFTSRFMINHLVSSIDSFDVQNFDAKFNKALFRGQKN